MPGELAYAASKGALHQLTASLAAHLAPRGITVNTVNPGATDTGYATEALYQAVIDREPLGRWGRPEDAARLIGWLAADEARWVTGQGHQLNRRRTLASRRTIGTATQKRGRQNILPSAFQGNDSIIYRRQVRRLRLL